MAHVVRLLAHELRLLRDCRGVECRRPLPPELQTRHPAAAYVPDPVAQP
jgi:hypothetical protein